MSHNPQLCARTTAAIGQSSRPATCAPCTGPSRSPAWLEADPEHWARYLDNETWACRQPGCLNGSTHLIIAVRPRSDDAGKTFG